MSSTLPVVIGLDGKTYPRFQLSAEERDFLMAACHHFAHDRRFSVRQIKQFLEKHGVPRSVGSIAAYLAQPCDKCRDDQHGVNRALHHNKLSWLGDRSGVQAGGG